MKEPNLEQKFQQDVSLVKKDLNTLKEDGINKVSEVSENLDQTTADVAARINSGVTRLSSEIEKVKNDATKTVVLATNTVKKNVGNSLSQYNAKVAEVAKKLPGDVGAKADKYPWVAASFALMAGFLLRGFLNPRRH